MVCVFVVVLCGVCRCGRGVVGGRGVCLVCVCVCLVCGVCVCCGTLKKKKREKKKPCGFKKASVCAFKTSPCMPQRVNIVLSLNWSMPYQGGCSQVLISSKGFDSSICDWKNKFSFFFEKISPSFALSLFE